MVVNREKEMENAQQLTSLGKLFWNNHNEFSTIKENYELQTTKVVKCFDQLVNAVLDELQFSVRTNSMISDQAPKAILRFSQKYDSQRRHLMTCWPSWGKTFELFYFYVLSDKEPDFNVFQDFADYLKSTLGVDSDQYIIAAGYSAWESMQGEL
jgi:hypothetical protein